MTELLQYTFFQNALWACLLTGIVCGLIGTYIVTRRMVFIAGGMAHASLGGVGICALMGWPPAAGAAIFALLTGYGVERLSHRREIREDSAIAMMWAFGMSIGVMCTFLSPTFLPSLSNYLFGNILLSTTADIVFLGILTVVMSLFFYLFLPQIVAIAYDIEFARSQKLPVERFNYILISLVALAIVASLRTAGIVMVISLLSIPQMTANLLSRTFAGMALWSVGICIICCLAGLVVSYWLNVPSGAAVILIAIIIYMVVRTIKTAFRGL